MPSGLSPPGVARGELDSLIQPRVVVAQAGIGDMNGLDGEIDAVFWPVEDIHPNSHLGREVNHAGAAEE